MKSSSSTHIYKKYCLFHLDKGHDIEDCYVLKKKIERLIVKGYLHQVLNKDFCCEQNREEYSQSPTALLEINVILGGTSASMILTIKRESMRNKSSPLLDRWFNGISQYLLLLKMENE
jgi:hypothetical protein